MLDWLADVNWLHLTTIPVFTGVIGWLINWTGLIMLFNPVRFHGIRIPGLQDLSTILPRKVQEVPGILQGGVGWQGIIPARAAKMGSIAVDKAISKIGTAGEFYEHLDPEQISEHILNSITPEIWHMVDDVMWVEHPTLWRDLPLPAKQAVVARVRAQLPDVVDDVTEQIGTHIDQLLDPKLMVIDHFSENPSLVVRIFRDFGQRELNLMVTFGLVFGFLLGIPVAVIDQIFGQWWMLPILGVFVGWTTNALGLWLIFEPVEPRKIGPLTIHGLFLRRQDRAAEVYARIIAEDVITLERVGDFLLQGPRADRTRRLLSDALRPTIDRAVGPAGALVRVALGSHRYDNIRESVTDKAVHWSMTPFKDPEFSRQQSENIRTLVVERTRELPSRDFVEMMRSAIKEDEWMLYAHGAIMGLAGGFLHLAIFGVA